MPSADLYGAACTFLEGDVFAAIDVEVPHTLKTGSVTVSRGERGRQQREVNAPDPTIQIVPVPAPASRWIGIGCKERDLVFDLRITSRVKDVTTGKNQLALVEKLSRALVYRYEGVTNLAISGTNVFFRRSSAQVLEVDAVHESSELIRSVVRLVLTFSEDEASNT